MTGWLGLDLPTWRHADMPTCNNKMLRISVCVCVCVLCKLECSRLGDKRKKKKNSTRARHTSQPRHASLQMPLLFYDGTPNIVAVMKFCCFENCKKCMCRFSGSNSLSATTTILLGRKDAFQLLYLVIMTISAHF